MTLIGSKNDGTFYSCGMHNLGFEDAIVRATMPPEDAAKLLERFLLYLLLAQPTLRPGETFSLDAKSPRYRLSKEACSTYEEGVLFHNPFGMWRLSPT